MYQSKFLKEEETKKKNFMPLLIVLAALVVLGGVAAWFFGTNLILDGEIYPKNSDFLNLRGEEVTFAHYNALREKLPGRRIYWDVPFQGGRYSDDITELTLTELTQEDIDTLAYFPNLETIHGEACEQYDLLGQIISRYPQVQVLYTVTIDGTDYPQDAKSLKISHLTEEEVALTAYLPQLESVEAEGCRDYAQLAALQAAMPGCAVNYNVELNGETYALDTKELNLTNQDIAELAETLTYLPQVATVHLVDPVGGAEAMNALREAYPNVTVTSELVGVTLSEDGVEVDLSAVKLTSLEDVDNYMTFYPDIKQVYLGQPDFDNEAISAFRESRREQYKVVWTVECGPLYPRTDTTWFHPIQEGVYYFFDEDAYNLRYCEDIIALDLGHMSIKSIEFVRFMPNLKYLVLALTTVLDISDLSTCKNLVFLEIDHTGVKDYTPLLGCTSLEDINLGRTYGDPTPIAQMTWLKNIWWMQRDGSVAAMLAEHLPDTKLVFVDSKNTTGYGWRKLPNYYAMRDALNMPYMN